MTRNWSEVSRKCEAKIYPNSKDEVKIGVKFEDVNQNLSELEG